MFKQLYQNVRKLVVQQIAFDIKIEFQKVKDSKMFDLYLSSYSSCFENLELLSTYNKPKYNSDVCLPRDKPFDIF